VDCPHGVIAGTLQKDLLLCTLPLQVRGRVCERGGSFVCVWVWVGGGGERRGEAVACDHPTGGSGALTGATESPGGWGAWLLQLGGGGNSRVTAVPSMRVYGCRGQRLVCVQCKA
jgi:hypothetical protein